MYIKVEADGSTRPFNVNELRREVDSVRGRVFRNHYNDNELAKLSVYRAYEPPKPDVNASTDKVEFDMAVEKDGRWEVVWKVTALTQAEKDDYNRGVRSALTCTARQARLALADGGMLDAVEAWVNESADNKIKIEWEYGTVVRRTSTWVEAFASAHGLSAEQLDALFWKARKL
jgi:hypothetical protein